MKQDFFTNNRKKLVNQINGLVVIAGHTQVQRSRDLAYEFEQDKSFWYLCGVDEPDYWLVLTPQEEFLIRPNVNEVEQWFEERSSQDRLRQVSGIEDIMSYRKGRARLKSLIKKYRKTQTLPTINSRYLKITPNPARSNLTTWLKRSGGQVETDKLASKLMNMRLVKQDVELEQIRKAVNVSVNAFKKIKHNLDSYDWEHQIEAAFTAEFRSSGLHHGYTPIVGAGVNATVLHYNTNAARLKRGDLVLTDIGARSEYYSADITRTYAYQETSTFAATLHRVVNAALEAGIKHARAGVSYLDIEKVVEQKVGEGLMQLGLITEPTRENIRSFYPHSGHFLGLDVHDVGDYRAPLRSGNVITIEPGVYLPDKAIGVRIEEDILITEAGCEVLSRSLSTEL